MPAAITADTLLVVCRDVVSTSVQGEEVILSLRDGVYFGLDPVGAVAWKSWQTPASPRQAAEHVAAVFDVTAEVAVADLIVLAETLCAKGLLEPAHAPAA